MAGMDVSKLSRGDQVIGASGILLLIFSFFKWYGVDIGGGKIGDIDIPGASFSRNGWQAPSGFLSLVAILIGIAMAGYVVAKLAGVELPSKFGTVSIGLAELIGGGVAFVFVLIKFISNTDATKIGIYAGLVFSAGLAAGGWLNFKAEKAGGGAVPPTV